MIALAVIAAASLVQGQIRQGKIRAHFQDTSIVDAIQQIARAGGFRFRIDASQVTGTITANFDRLEISDALNQILAQADPKLTFHVEHGTVVIDEETAVKQPKPGGLVIAPRGAWGKPTPIDPNKPELTLQVGAGKSFNLLATDSQGTYFVGTDETGTTTLFSLLSGHALRSYPMRATAAVIDVPHARMFAIVQNAVWVLPFRGAPEQLGFTIRGSEAVRPDRSKQALITASPDGKRIGVVIPDRITRGEVKYYLTIYDRQKGRIAETTIGAWRIQKMVWLKDGRIFLTADRLHGNRLYEFKNSSGNPLETVVHDVQAGEFELNSKESLFAWTRNNPSANRGCSSPAPLCSTMPA